MAWSLVSWIFYFLFYFYIYLFSPLNDELDKHKEKKMRENDPVNLRLHEAYYIRKYKPGLNSREECTELNDLLF